MPNRAERRRQDRANRKAADGKIPTLIVGDNIAAVSLPDHTYAARDAELPAKVPGKHRWVAMATWSLTEPQVTDAADADKVKLLDHENMVMLSIGCWDCEHALGEISVGGRCDA